MDFTWVNDGKNPRNKTLQNISTSPVRASNDMDKTSSNNQASSRLSFTQNLNSTSSTTTPVLRRSRADTMPSQSSVFPYASDVFSNVMSLNDNNNGNNNSNSSSSSNTNNTSSLPLSSRHRSGSLTLPQHEFAESMRYTNPPFGYNPYDPSSPIDENASSTIASTLASLGLDDENHTHASTTNTNFVDSQHHTRARSYTVAGQLENEMSSSRLSPFSPFSPHTRTNLLHRPRAISLGMADSFSPFDLSQNQSPSGITPTPSTNILSQSRLRQQIQPDSPLRPSHSNSNMMEMNIDHMYNIIDDEDLYDPPDDADSPSSAQAQIPSRALWLGNVNPSINVPELMKIFSVYGQVESARILSDKECAFVNFTTVESAVAAKNDLETRLDSKLGGTPVRVGFGKADVNLAMALSSEAGPNAQGPTRALWIGNIPANMNPTILQTIFQAFGPIESVRVLSHKNCGFINFEHQEDAVRARKTFQNREILGPGTGPVRIGFAKVLPNNPDEIEEVIGTNGQVTPPQVIASQPSLNLNVNNNTLNSTLNNARTSVALQTAAASSGADTYQATQWATAVMMTNMMMNASGQQQTTQPSLYTAIASERQLIMQQLGQEIFKNVKEDRIPLTYFTVIPAVLEFSADRTLEPLRLREMRKYLEKEEQLSLEEVEPIVTECMDNIVELCSDYIGNTVVQKLFEHCSEDSKLKMLQKIAPFLASIGVHKNGTWAAQKIIDYSNTKEQIQLIHQYIAPYVPLLLLDQFGNYVVQCCLRKGSEHNQYIFDAIVDKCWEIGQGRFGARAVRSILENPIVTKEQQVYVAAAVVQNTVLLTTNANGVLLLNWLLDSSGLVGRYRVLCPRLLPYLNKLSSHKLGSITVSKVLNQTEEPDASALILSALSDKAKGELLNSKK
ncbi:MAG: hypothetical protein EXX96DRAFT_563633 [Benjaminiella poitrasii]|nr:MAG: hypothetical protein EXX96DRAFT_563633 [Benjaminiella poitrasii]